MLIATTGMEYFYRSQNYILIGFFISTFYFIKSKHKINKHLIFILVPFVIIEIFQFLHFGGFNFRTFLGTYIRLFFAYSVVLIVQKNIFKIFTTIIFFFSIVSLVFYIFTFIPGISEFYIEKLGNIIPNIFVEEGFYKGSKNLILFNFHENALKSFRNSGPFWEPGAFAVFLLIALVFNHINDKRILSKVNSILILTILTTLSTTGFICLFIFFFYINYNLLKTNVLFIVFFILSIFTIVLLFERIPFLKDKIEKDIEYSNETTTSRFGSALADYNLFKSSPLFGYGRAGAKNDFKDDKFFEVEDHRNNGVFNLLVTYGIFITTIYLYQILKTFKEIGKLYKLPNYYFIFSFVILISLAFSQGILMRPFFYSFLFLPMLFDKTLTNKFKFENRIINNNI